MDDYANIPQDMKQLNHWVCWRYEERGGKKTKVPYSVLSGAGAKSNEPLTWTSYSLAVEASRNYDGIGFMFSGSSLVGIDLDHCLDNGELSPLAKEIVQELNSYTEISPSGSGLHIIARGQAPPGGNRSQALGLEMYSEGRYFTITGQVYSGLTDISEAQAAVNSLHEKYLAKEKKPRLAQGKTLSLEDIIRRAAGSKQGEAFEALMAGRWQREYESQSQADQALCNMLAFWTGKDAAQMDAMFRLSGLMRNKWDEKRGSQTYGEITIGKAIADCLAVYEGKKDAGCTSSDWFPVVDEDNKPLKAHWRNTEWLLCKKIGMRVRYNVMKKCVEVTGARTDNMTFEAMLTHVRGLCHERGLRIGKADLSDSIGRIAEGNKYSPVVNFLDACLVNWDGQSRIEQLFNCFILDDAIPQERGLLLALFRKWLISCVIMAYNDGTKAAQGMLVLKGPQGIGKTRWLYYLLPDPTWGKDGVALDPTQKDDLLKALNYWVVELGEVRASIRREKLDRLKAFTTESTDVMRAPYGRAVETRPRTTVFYGTVNNDEFLKDETGERRYWVIAIKDICLDASLDRAQLWGEVAGLALKDKEPYWLNKDEMARLNLQNEYYRVRPPEEQALFDCLDWSAPANRWQRRTASEVCGYLGFHASQAGHVGRALRRLSERTGIIPPTTNRDKSYLIPPYANSVSNGYFERVL